MYVKDLLNNSTQTFENPFRFPGQCYDPETGLHYNYFRYYNPQTGRYITPDPIGLWGGINLFAYTENNPVNWIDADGLIRLAIAAMGYGDEATFRARARRTNDVVLTPSSGKELLSLLSRYSSQNDPITGMSVFSHAYSRGIIFKNMEGFYGSQDLIGEIASFLGIWDQRDIDDLISMISKGKMFFSKDAVVKLFGCNLATGDFAQKLANAINATVIAGKGAVSPEIVGGKETGWMWADKGFYQYSPNHAPVSIGKRIYGR